MTRVVIIGGGPGGYEAALVGAQLGASVTVVAPLIPHPAANATRIRRASVAR